MIYTCHIGPREEAFPPAFAEHGTREAAQAAVKTALAAAPASVTKGEVRHRVRLLDSYGKRPTGTIRQVYAFKQRQVGAAGAAEELPL